MNIDLFVLFHQNILDETENTSKFVSEKRALGHIFKFTHIMQTMIPSQEQKIHMCFHRLSTQIACHSKILKTVL